MKKAIVRTTVIYFSLVLLFLAVAFIATDGGNGWEWFEAVVCALLTLPIYALLCAVLYYRGTKASLSRQTPRRGYRWDAFLNVFQLCAAAVCFTALLPSLWAIVAYIPNHTVRHMISFVCPPLLLTSFWCWAVAILNQPVAKLLVSVLRKVGLDSMEITKKPILITRVSLFVVALALACLYWLCLILVW